jgi:hypothetical protein
MKKNRFPELLARHPGDLLGEEAENAYAPIPEETYQIPER